MRERLTRLYHAPVKAHDTQLHVRLSLDGTTAKIVRIVTVKDVGPVEHLIAIMSLNADGGWDAVATDGTIVEHRTFGSPYSAARWMRPLQDVNKRPVESALDNPELDHTLLLTADGVADNNDRVHSDRINAKARKIERDRIRAEAHRLRMIAVGNDTPDTNDTVQPDGTVTVTVNGVTDAAATNAALDSILG